MNDLKPIHRETLDYIRAFIDANGYPPTVREMCEPLGVSSPSSVHGRLDVLERAGYIERLGVRMVIKVKEEA